MSGLPEYVVKVSQRAKHARLHLSPDGGLTVIIPKRFDKRRIPQIVEEKRDWIERNLKRFDEMLRNGGSEPEEADALPERLSLKAIGEEWTVVYRHAPGARLDIDELDGFVVALTGRTNDTHACRGLLRDFLAYKAKRHLVPMLNGIAKTLGFTVGKVGIRAQNTRWGSCSGGKTISLNLKLLFLPVELVRYVMIHELCHTVHPNHSKEFWSLVELHDPDWKSHRKTLKDTMFTHVPRWLREG